MKKQPLSEMTGLVGVLRGGFKTVNRNIFRQSGRGRRKGRQKGNPDQGGLNQDSFRPIYFQPRKVHPGWPFHQSQNNYGAVISPVAVLVLGGPATLFYPLISFISFYKKLKLKELVKGLYRGLFVLYIQRQVWEDDDKWMQD